MVFWEELINIILILQSLDIVLTLNEVKKNKTIQYLVVGILIIL